jgi:hypothetical protein
MLFLVYTSQVSFSFGGRGGVETGSHYVAQTGLKLRVLLLLLPSATIASVLHLVQSVSFSLLDSLWDKIY